MTTALVVGAGAVGARVAALLADRLDVEQVLVSDARAARAGEVAEALGERASAVSWSPDDPLPPEVGVVACAVPGDADVAVALRAVEAGVPAATCGETPDGVRRLLALDDLAREAGVAVAVGAGFAPGLSEVLARYALETVDAVDEVHVARYGVAGAASARRRWLAAVRPGWELDRGGWVRRTPGSARRLVVFPPPVGPQECRRTASAVPLAVAASLPGVRRVSAREALRRLDMLTGAVPGPSAVAPWRAGGRTDGLGALWVEVRARRGSAREVITLGAVDRTAAATAAVLAVATTTVVGLGPPAAVGRETDDEGRPLGAAPLAALVDPVPLLRELARLGTRAAVFEGVASDQARTSSASAS